MEKAIKAFREKLHLWQVLSEWTKDPNLKIFFSGEAAGALHLMEEIFPDCFEDFRKIYASYGFC